MAKVPTYDNLTVDTGAAPADRIQAGQAVPTALGQPGAFQPGVIQPIQVNNTPALSEGLATLGGRQLMGAGDALMNAGTSMAQVAIDAQRQMNELRIDDSLNKTKEEALKAQFDKDSGFMSQTGYAALERQSGKPLSVEFGDQLRDKVKTISEGLGNDAQRRAYMMRANDMVTQFEGQAQSHMLQQAKVYSASVAKGTIENQINEIGLNFNNPARVDQAINGQYGEVDGQMVLVQKGLRQAVYDYGRAHGMAATEIEALTRQKISDAHTVAIDSFITQGDIAGANSYLNGAVRAKQMDANDILKVQKVLKGEIDTQHGVTIANNTFNENRPANTPTERMVNVLKPFTQGNSQFMAPVAGPLAVSSGFGPRSDPHGGGGIQSHEGMDYKVPMGTSVQAAAAGEVSAVGDDGNKGYGKYIDITHADGTKTRYAHLSSADVKVGGGVAQGAVIGASGSSGNSTGPHLHFEVLGKDGKKIDPSAALAGGGNIGASLETNIKKYSAVPMAVAATVVGDKAIGVAISAFEADPKNKGLATTFSNISDYLPTEQVAQISKALQQFDEGGGARKNPTLQELQTNALERLGPNTSRRTRLATIEEVNRLYDVNTKAVAQRDLEVLTSAQDAVIKNGGNYNGLSAAIRNSLKPGQVDDVIAFANKIAAGPGYSNPDVYNLYANNPDALRRLKTPADVDRLRASLSSDDFKAISKQWGDATGQATGSVKINTSHIESRLNLLLPQLDIVLTDKDNAAKVAMIRRVINDQVAQTQDQTGKQLNEVEINQLIDKTMARVASPSTWTFDPFNLRNNESSFQKSLDSKPLLLFKYTDISREGIADIRKRLKDKGDTEPSEQQILGVFLDDKLGIKR